LNDIYDTLPDHMIRKIATLLESPILQVREQNPGITRFDAINQVWTALTALEKISYLRVLHHDQTGQLNDIVDLILFLTDKGTRQ